MVKYSRLAIAHLLALVMPLAAQRADIKFEHLSVDQGLSQSSVMSIAQDPLGFLWFGTQDGLNKYDGIGFKTYRQTADSATTLGSRFIFQVYADRHGKLWLASEEAGLQMFDPVSELVKTYETTFCQVDGKEIGLRGFDEDSQGNLWMASTSGLSVLDREQDCFQHYAFDNGDSSEDALLTFLIDSKDDFWVGHSRLGLFKFNPKSGDYSQLVLSNDEGKLEISRVRNIFEDSQGEIWIATAPTGVIRFWPQTGKFKIYQHKNHSNGCWGCGSVNGVAEDERKNLWFGTGDNGINFFERTTEKFINLKHEPYEETSLSSNHVVSVFADRSGTIWVGTSGGGINKHDPGKEKFVHYRNSMKNPEALQGNMIWALFEDSRGLTWIGTMSGGLNMLDRRTDEFRIFRHDPHDDNSISSDHILAIAEDRNGILWIGTNRGGLNRFDSKTEKFRRFVGNPRSKEGLLSYSVQAIVPDESGYLWLATRGGGLHKFNTTDESFAHYLHDENDPETISSNILTTVFQASDGRLWIGTMPAGLNSFDPKTETFKRYCTDCDSGKLAGDYIMSIAEDADRNIWVGTYSGLTKLVPATAELTSYTTKDGLPNDVIYGVLIDGKNRVWTSTNSGLSRFDPETGVFRNFVLEDGLQSLEFNSCAYFKNSAGEMFFGGINGFNVFHPDSVRDNPNPPPVAITAIKKFDKHVPLPARPDENLQFSYSDNFIQFEFVALDYTNPARNRYAYKLEGLHEDWIDAGTQRYATFTNLHPDEYVFHVKGANNDGIWNETGASIRFVVTPPFWQTWWFRIMMALAGISAFYLTVKLLRERARKDADLKKKFSELKLQALRAQMNPHFVFNTINSIQYYISSNDQKSAYQYLSKFAKLMRMVLDNSEKSSQTLSEELEALRLYLELESLRFEGKFTYSLDVSPNIDIHNSEIPAMLIQPFVENAIQHGLQFKRTKGSLHIKLSLVQNDLICMIEDNGIGIEKSLKLKSKQNGTHKSAGIKVSRERLETLNALRKNGRGIEIMDLSTSNGNSQGTRVKIVIPMENL